MTSAKFMTLTLSLTLIYDPNPNPNPIPCEILDVEILDACADSPIVINFASGEFRATPGGGGGGAFHQAFCQCFSLTNLLSANQMQGFQ